MFTPLEGEQERSEEMGNEKPLRLEHVPSVGTERVRGLGLTRNRGEGARCRPVELDMPKYPDDVVQAGRELQKLRRSLMMSIGDAATAWGVGAFDVMGVEQGRLRCDHEEAGRRLRAFKEPRA